MPSKAQVCLCRSHGCADEVRTSRITGQVLKGRYLGDMEFRSHQRDESSFRLSGLREPLPRWQAMAPDRSDTSQSLTSAAAPSSPPHPSRQLISESFQNHTSLAIEPEPMAPGSHCIPDTLLAYSSPSTQPEQSSEPPCALNSVATEPCPAQGHIERNLSAVNPTSQGKVTQENRIMQAIENCRFDFQSWQRANISSTSDELIFEVTPAD